MEEKDVIEWIGGEQPITNSRVIKRFIFYGAERQAQPFNPSSLPEKINWILFLLLLGWVWRRTVEWVWLIMIEEWNSFQQQRRKQANPT